MRYGRAVTRVIGAEARTPLRTTSTAPTGNDSGDDLLHRLLGDPEAIDIPFEHRRRERLRLVERDVRRQRRHIGIGDRFEDNRSVRTESLVPRRTDLLRPLDLDATQPDQFG